MNPPLATTLQEPRPGREPPRRRSAVFAGWAMALLWAAVAFVGMAVFAELVVFLVWLAGGRAGSPGTVARVGGLLFFWFHHVGLVFRLSAGALGGTVRASGSLTVAAAPMLGTALAVWLLYLGGRAVVRVAGSRGTVSALHGAEIAVPYVALCVAGSFATRLSSADLVGGFASIHPSVLGAVLWPLLIAAVSGVAGGLFLRDERRRDGAVEAVASGAWTMLWTGLLLSFAGLLVLGAVRPATTGAYFDGAFRRGPARGAAVLGLNALVLPNMASWVLAASTGDCISVETSSTGGRCFLSYRRLPNGRALAASVAAGRGAAPTAGESRPSPAFLLFLLVPAVASVAGGARTARRVGPGGAGRAMLTGAASGVLFAGLMALALALSSVTVAATGSIGLVARSAAGSVRAAVGPRLALGVALAAGWGVLGGAIGAAVLGRRARSSANEPDRGGLPPAADERDHTAEDGEQRGQ